MTQEQEHLAQEGIQADFFSRIDGQGADPAPPVAKQKSAEVLEGSPQRPRERRERREPQGQLARVARVEAERDWMREWTTDHSFYDTRFFRPELTVEEMITSRPLEGWRPVSEDELRELQRSKAINYFAYIDGITCIHDPDNYLRFQDGSRRLTWPSVGQASRVVEGLRSQGHSDEEIKQAWLAASGRQFRYWETYLWGELEGFHQRTVSQYHEQAMKQQQLNVQGEETDGSRILEALRNVFLTWVEHAEGAYQWYASYPLLQGRQPRPVPGWLVEFRQLGTQVQDKEASG